MHVTRTLRNAVLVSLCAVSALPAEAAVATYGDKAPFLDATGAASATGALPSLTGSILSAHIGSVTFHDVNGFGFWVGGLEAYTPPDWTSLLPGHEIAVNHVENLNVVFDAPVYAAGFDFVEPASQVGMSLPSSPYANDNAYPYADSTFTVTLKSGSAVVSIFNFNAPDEVASFVGVWSDTAFDRMEIRETTGGIEDDYFGQFYSGTVAMPVPESSTYAMLLAGLGLVGFAVRRRSATAF